MKKRIQLFGAALILLLATGSQVGEAQDLEVLCDWEDGGTCWSWDFSDGATNFDIVDNPASDAINSSAKVQRFTTDPNAGFPIFLHDYSANAEPNVDLADWPVYKMKVYTTVSGGSVLLKFEDAGNTPGVTREVQKSVTPGEWQELIFEFDSPSTGLIKMVIFPNFLTAGTPNDGSWYFDDLIRTRAVDTSSEDEILPNSFALDQNYPNPFNPTTSISYSLDAAGPVSLKVYSLLGQEIATLVDGFQPAGAHEKIFNAGDLPSGMYIYRLVSGNQTQVRKMMLLK